jgi:hypothetical protein
MIERGPNRYGIRHRFCDMLDDARMSESIRRRQDPSAFERMKLAEGTGYETY